MIAIRSLEPADLEDILAITATSPGATAWGRATYEALHANPMRGRVLVAEQQGVVAGFACFRVVDEEAELLNLAVRPSFRHRGIGIQLVERVLRDARQAGATRIFLEVRASNAAALSLYERLGFRRCGRRADYYADPPDDALVFHQELESPVLDLRESLLSE